MCLNRPLDELDLEAMGIPKAEACAYCHLSIDEPEDKLCTIGPPKNANVLSGDLIPFHQNCYHAFIGVNARPERIQ